jgi:hypothetical protein
MTKHIRSLSIATLFCAFFGTVALADGTSPSFPFAATGTLGGGWAFLEEDASFEPELRTIVAGGQFVVPVTGFWNIQFGGQWRYDYESINDFSATSFDGSALGFWRDSMLGTLGIETGFFSEAERASTFAKIGGVGEYFVGETATIAGYGGLLIPISETPQFADDTEGFYAGARLTWYVQPNFAISGQFSFYQSNWNNPRGPGAVRREDVAVGGTLRYLTSMPGVELFALANYREADSMFAPAGQPYQTTSTLTGSEVLAGVRIRLGGQTDSLVAIDRTNAIDTDFHPYDVFW